MKTNGKCLTWIQRPTELSKKRLVEKIMENLEKKDLFMIKLGGDYGRKLCRDIVEKMVDDK